MRTWDEQGASVTRLCVVAQVVGHLEIHQRQEPILSDSGKLLFLVEVPRSG